MDQRKHPVDSTTNASDAVDAIQLPSKPTSDEVLDAGVKETFPASDPVSVAQHSETTYDFHKRGEHPPAPPQLPKRSPDWMFEKK